MKGWGAGGAAGGGGGGREGGALKLSLVAKSSAVLKIQYSKNYHNYFNMSPHCDLAYKHSRTAHEDSNTIFSHDTGS